MTWFRRERKKETAPAVAIAEISQESELDEALTEGPVVLYKHSYRCGLCVRSRKQIEEFARLNPEIPVLQIDVIKSRALSNLIADRFGVRHESPQAIVVRDGDALWNASHSSVTAERVGEAAAAT